MRISRRKFIQTTPGLLATASFIGQAAATQKLSANDRLNIGVIGVANRGAENLEGISSQNIVALCDIDEDFLGAAATKYPQARTYHDFRKLLDQKNLDAVVISTADHTHAVATVAALERTLHVYCEKPLARTISESHVVAETARRQRVATQLGTQIHAGNNYRRVVELIQSGAIGSVREVQVWVRGGFSNVDRFGKYPASLPDHVHYDLWLGPLPYRPYSPDYLPFRWRRWWAFAGGTLADLGCHHIDLSHWALGLGHPLTAEAEGPPIDPERTPKWLIVRYEHPAREEKPPLTLTWHHGGKRPPYFAEGKLPQWGDGTLFVGEKGMLLAGYNQHVLLPEKDFDGFERPALFIPDSIGHYEEWFEACKTGAPTTCNFDYGGTLTEVVLLGNVSYRTGKKLEWDPANLKATNCPEADQFIQHHYGEGWKI